MTIILKVYSGQTCHSSDAERSGHNCFPHELLPCSPGTKLFSFYKTTNKRASFANPAMPMEFINISASFNHPACFNTIIMNQIKYNTFNLSA